MNERKLQFQEKIQKIKSERDRTINLLEKLINMSECSVAGITDLDDSWLLSHAQYFLELHSFQYMLHHKLLSLNLDLEVFYNRLQKNKLPDVNNYCCANRSQTSHYCENHFRKWYNTLQSLSISAFDDNLNESRLERVKASSPCSCIVESVETQKSDSPLKLESIIRSESCETIKNDSPLKIESVIRSQSCETIRNDSPLKLDSVVSPKAFEEKMNESPLQFELVDNFGSFEAKKDESLLKVESIVSSESFKTETNGSLLKPELVGNSGSFVTQENDSLLRLESVVSPKSFETKTNNPSLELQSFISLKDSNAAMIDPLLKVESVSNSEIFKTKTNCESINRSISKCDNPIVFKSMETACATELNLLQECINDAQKQKDAVLNLDESQNFDNFDQAKKRLSDIDEVSDISEHKIFVHKNCKKGDDFICFSSPEESDDEVNIKEDLEDVEFQEVDGNINRDVMDAILQVSHENIPTERKDVKEDDLCNDNNVNEIVLSSENDEKHVELEPSTSDYSQTIRELEKPPLPKAGDFCMILHIVSPSEFYIQIGDEKSEQLDLMERDLNNYYRNSLQFFYSKSQAKARAKKEKYFAAYVNRWQEYYRVEITDWLLDLEEDIIVKAIDYGNFEKISMKDLRILQDRFYDLPKAVQRCHFECLYPVGSGQKVRLVDWPEEAVDLFYDIVGDMNESIFEITYALFDSNRNSVGVELIKRDSTSEISVAQALIDNGLAIDMPPENDGICLKNDFIKEQIKRAQGYTGDLPQDEALDTFFSNCKDMEPLNVNEAVMHYNPKDEAKTCPFQRKDGTCFKGKRCKLRHVPLPKDGFTADKVPIYSYAFNELELPLPGSTVTVKITNIIDIQRFYVQLIRKNNVSGQPTKEMTLQNFIRHMNDQNIRKDYKKFRYLPAVGEVIIVKHWDGNWYRGKVLDVSENGRTLCSMEVFIVDFGEIINVKSLESIRQISPEFLHFPFQAVECHFHNVKHKDGVDPEAERTYFEERYIYEYLVARIIENPGHLEVLLFDDKGEDVGSKLVEAGFGEFKKEYIFPTQKSCLLID